MLLPWPKRGHSLLELGCGTGIFLEFFRQNGFDVTGMDRPSPQLDEARHRLGSGADIQAGTSESLPFDDNTFDYVALMSPLPAETAVSDENDPMLAHTILREAVRVSARGVLVRCWNPCSLAGLWRQNWLCPSLSRHESEDEEQALHALWLGWRDYCAMLRTLSPGGAIRTRSTLCGPPSSWHEGHLARRINCLDLSLPLGAVIFLRLTHDEQSPLTSLPLRLGSLRMESPRPATVMERKHNPGHIQTSSELP